MMPIKSMGFLGLLFGVSALLIAIFETDLTDEFRPSIQPKPESTPDRTRKSTIKMQSSRTPRVEDKRIEESKEFGDEEGPKRNEADESKHEGTPKKKGRLKALAEKFSRKKTEPETTKTPEKATSDHIKKTPKKRGLKSVLKERFSNKKTTKKRQRSTTEKRQKTVTPPKSPPNQWVKRGIMILGSIAIIFGVLAWVRKERLRPAMAAIALGVAALAWKYVLIVAVILIIVLILSALASAG